MSVAGIVVIGSSNTDMVIQTGRLPGPGETVLGGRFSMVAGGKGANQAVAAARAGGRVSLVARIGADLFGDRAVESLAAEGIDVGCIRRDRDLPSGVALIFVDGRGENSIAVAEGSNGRLSVQDIRDCRKEILAADVLVMQLEIPLECVTAAAALAAGAGVRVILNPAPAASLPDGLLRNVSVLTPNEVEAAALAGIEIRDEDSAGRAAEALLRQGVPAVVITRGSRGAVLADGRGVDVVPAFEVDVVDSTGAGDAFNGALAVALGEGRELRPAVRFASAAAALAVRRLGAQSSIPRREEIDAFLGDRG